MRYIFMVSPALTRFIIASFIGVCMSSTMMTCISSQLSMPNSLKRGVTINIHCNYWHLLIYNPSVGVESIFFLPSLLVWGILFEVERLCIFVYGGETWSLHSIDIYVSVCLYVSACVCVCFWAVFRPVACVSLKGDPLFSTIDLWGSVLV